LLSTRIALLSRLIPLLLFTARIAPLLIVLFFLPLPGWILARSSLIPVVCHLLPSSILLQISQRTSDVVARGPRCHGEDGSEWAFVCRQTNGRERLQAIMARILAIHV
jgi:hypothetical protein